MNLIKEINKVIEIFKINFENESLIQVGSSVNKKIYHDIDFIIITSDYDFVVNKLYDIFSNYIITKIDDSIKISNYLDIELSFAIYKKDYFFSLIENYNAGKHIICEHKTWSIGYWLIEGFINDLKNSSILIDNHNLFELKAIISKQAIYGETRILKECIEEIKIKKNLLNNNNNFECDILENDIYFAALRAFSILAGNSLNGFKNLEEKVKRLPLEYQELINNIFSSNNIEKAIDIISKKINSLNNLYMGTWQFNGQFKKFTDDEVIQLLKIANENGINRFDTALVYGQAEKYISNLNNDNNIILTKIPAKEKPPLEENVTLSKYYTREYIEECINKSLSNLNRDYIDIILLHNWNCNWDNYPELIDWLLDLKKRNLVKKIGISLPNGYNRCLSPKILCYIDVIEAPYNEDNKWIKKDIELYKKYNIEIILRSLFLQGKSLKNKAKDYKDIIKFAKRFETSLVIGMTTEEQIINNIESVGDCDE